jgi:hypothetical protein
MPEKESKKILNADVRKFASRLVLDDKTLGMVDISDEMRERVHALLVRAASQEKPNLFELNAHRLRSQYEDICIAIERVCGNDCSLLTFEEAMGALSEEELERVMILKDPYLFRFPSPNPQSDDDHVWKLGISEGRRRCDTNPIALITIQKLD